MITAKLLTVFGSDYVPDNLIFTFDSAGEICENISILVDNSIEGDHTLTVTISSASPNVLLSAYGSQSITILDIDGM